MKEHPILFTPENAQKVHDGTKTMTRRACPLLLPGDKDYINTASTEEWAQKRAAQAPYKVGDRLWVREKFWVVERKGQGIGVPFLIYENEWDHSKGASVPDERAPLRLCMMKFGPHSSIHMPRWASRTTLEVTAVRCERLQEISEADARAEAWASVASIEWRVKAYEPKWPGEFVRWLDKQAKKARYQRRHRRIGERRGRR